MKERVEHWVEIIDNGFWAPDDINTYRIGGFDMTLFSLNLTDLALSDKTHREDFFIGLFGTRAQAEAVAAHYLKQVPGFCDYDCTYRVEEKSIHNVQRESLPDFVWQFAGWDGKQKDGEPVNIIKSDFFDGGTGYLRAGLPEAPVPTSGVVHPPTQKSEKCSGRSRLCSGVESI